MTGEVLLLASAVADVERAVRWYDGQAPGLGRLFLVVLDQQLRRLEQFPSSYPRLNAECRRANLQRFPYAVVYRVASDVIQVIAVMHCRADSAARS